MYDDAVDQIVMLLHKKVHDKTKPRHDNDIRYDIWDHLDPHKI